MRSSRTAIWNKPSRLVRLDDSEAEEEEDQAAGYQGSVSYGRMRQRDVESLRR